MCEFNQPVDDDVVYELPARVVGFSQVGSVFVRLFLGKSVEIDNEISYDKPKNIFLKNAKNYNLSQGDCILVEVEGWIVNQYILMGRIDKEEQKNRSVVFIRNLDEQNYQKHLDDNNIIISFDKLKEMKKKKDELLEEISEQSKELKELQDNIQTLREISSIEKANEFLKEEKNELLFFKQENQWLEKVKPYIVNENSSAIINDESIPNDQIKIQLSDIVKAIKYRFNLSDNFIYCYLSSLFTSLIQGRFLLLTGHIGTGKSSIIKETGKLMGGQTNMIAVRPAWLDSSDLLGYFDPINNRYHTTDFLKFLRKEDNNRINMILLDELNIARIENYGADILARLSPIGKRQEEQNKIQLFNQDLQELIYTYQLFEELADDKKQRYQPILDRIKQSSSVVIPDNVLICGTLNIDGSTENLSPKMIDRSFMLKFPDFNGRLDKTEEEIVGQYNVPMHQIITILERQDKISVEKWNNFYDHFIKDIENLLIPISNRVAKDYLVFRQFSEIFNLGDAEKIDALFFYARILPRLRIERASSENKDNFVKILKKFGRMDIFENFINVIDSELNGSFIDYQHICG